jgi:hypothetical protein
MSRAPQDEVEPPEHPASARLGRASGARRRAGPRRSAVHQRAWGEAQRRQRAPPRAQARRRGHRARRAQPRDGQGGALGGLPPHLCVHADRRRQEHFAGGGVARAREPEGDRRHLRPPEGSRPRRGRRSGRRRVPRRGQREGNTTPRTSRKRIGRHTVRSERIAGKPTEPDAGRRHADHGAFGEGAGGGGHYKGRFGFNSLVVSCGREVLAGILRPGSWPVWLPATKCPTRTPRCGATRQ